MITIKEVTGRETEVTKTLHVVLDVDGAEVEEVVTRPRSADMEDAIYEIASKYGIDAESIIINLNIV